MSVNNIHIIGWTRRGAQREPAEIKITTNGSSNGNTTTTTNNNNDNNIICTNMNNRSNSKHDSHNDNGNDNGLGAARDASLRRVGRGK